jgi:hypothetical protein
MAAKLQDSKDECGFQDAYGLIGKSVAMADSWMLETPVGNGDAFTHLDSQRLDSEVYKIAVPCCLWIIITTTSSSYLQSFRSAPIFSDHYFRSPHSRCVTLLLPPVFSALLLPLPR